MLVGVFDKKILEIINMHRPTPEQRARTSASICTGPVFIDVDGRRVFSREKTKEAYDKMYNIFLESYSKDDA
jgi:hypothetical protein